MIPNECAKYCLAPTANRNPNPKPNPNPSHNPNPNPNAKGYLHRLEAQAEEAQDEYVSARFGIPPLQAHCAEISRSLIQERQKPSLSKDDLERKHQERQAADAKLAAARHHLPDLKASMDSAQAIHRRTVAAV